MSGWVGGVTLIVTSSSPMATMTLMGGRSTGWVRALAWVGGWVGGLGGLGGLGRGRAGGSNELLYALEKVGGWVGGWVGDLTFFRAFARISWLRRREGAASCAAA